MRTLREMVVIIINGLKYFARRGSSDVRVVTRDGATSIIVGKDLIATGITDTVIRIVWEGDLANLHCNVADVNGSIIGDVKTNTLKMKGDIHGNVRSNSVHCGNVGGDISANSVTRRI